MSLNIIIKNKTPHWRKNQPTLGKFQSLRRDPNTIDGNVAVEKQFSLAEQMKIASAIRTTNAMNIDMSKGENE